MIGVTNATKPRGCRGFGRLPAAKKEARGTIAAKRQPTAAQKRYAVYLASPHWRARRLVALGRAGNRCEKCPSTKTLQVHHRNYARLGCELDKDLQVLCAPCHRKAHKLRGKKKGRKKKKQTIGVPAVTVWEHKRLEMEWLERAMRDD